MVALPGPGVTTKPSAHFAVGAEAGLKNHACWPRYQIAVQSPWTSARAYVWPAEARAPWSETYIVSGVPLGRRPRSLTSGASGLGAVRRMTDEEPRSGHGTANTYEIMMLDESNLQALPARSRTRIRSVTASRVADR